MPSVAVEPAAAFTVPVPRGRGRQDWRSALFVAPYLLVFVAMLVVPLAMGMWLSTTKGDLFGTERWVGLANFVRLFGDAIFLKAVANTFYFVLLTVPFLTLAGLGLALVLNRQERWAAVLRTIFFASTVLSVTVVTLVWRLVFLPDGGLLGVTAEALGKTPIAFLNDERLAMPAIAVTTIWWCIGLPMVLFLAALQQVPRDLYEAAALDNASRWTTLTRITLPAIKRTFFLVIIIEVILQFQLFGQPQLMTLGGPNNSTRPIVLFIYEAGWRQWELGYAAAAAQVLFAMILIAAMVQYRLSSGKEAA
ncbi:multiple sugar transport system permease protein [Sphingomonas naasensis]|uniref:Sugar ABC transporter permease n=1 Tax=Sphingomonas naasensis TaxID=1344951 RepID=A0A4S1WJL3_9SPHN|nr:sugar ABC transporter permease [Sphingomonas naasensis]NIJ20930.1 multiple sugar transport system permease protein [Sphingomonas naasensis]TGX43319.1 sugar ABC transporter permease [Sphingomonas naasensis]